MNTHKRLITYKYIYIYIYGEDLYKLKNLFYSCFLNCFSKRGKIKHPIEYTKHYDRMSDHSQQPLRLNEVDESSNSSDTHLGQGSKKEKHSGESERGHSDSSNHDLENGVNDYRPQDAIDNPLQTYYPDLVSMESHATLSRELSRRITNADALKLADKEDLDGTLYIIGEGRELPPDLPDRTPYVVSFNGINDPYHPHNYPMYKKIMYTFCVGVSAFSLSLGSAMFAEGNEDVMEIYHVGYSVAALGTSLYVFGFAAGPVIHGPLSELFGRKIILVISSLGYVCFSFGVATAKDLQTIMLCRFFAAFTGSASFVVAPAVMVDMFAAKWRGVAIAIFACCIFGGPMLAPILGGFTEKNSSLGWRWCSYFSGIVGSFALFCNIFILGETHHPLLLVRKAELLRRKTGNWGIFAPHEEHSLDLKELVVNNIGRPLKLIATEPIISLVSIYNAFIYAMLYTFLTAIPLIFIGRYGWSQGVGELPYISMLLGVFAGGGTIVWFEQHVQKKQEKFGRKPVPEDRLPPIMIGGFTFVIGIFWLGWTGDYAEHVHWIVPTIAAFFVGHGLISIFLPTMNYIIDCYLFIAASALAANTFIRSAFAAAFPLFARQMFVNLTIKWASTLVGCLGALMIPMPFLFYKYGAAIRKRSKYALH